jgi:uncharacterized lipoprotein YajG
MKKTIMILLLIALTALLVVGCSKQPSSQASVNTQVSVQNDAVDAQTTQGINDASTTSDTLDTAQTDVQLGTANKSLANW